MPRESELLIEVLNLYPCDTFTTKTWVSGSVATCRNWKEASVHVFAPKKEHMHAQWSGDMCSEP